MQTSAAPWSLNNSVVPLPLSHVSRVYTHDKQQNVTTIRPPLAVADHSIGQEMTLSTCLPRYTVTHSTRLLIRLVYHWFGCISRSNNTNTVLLISSTQINCICSMSTLNFSHTCVHHCSETSSVQLAIIFKTFKPQTRTRHTCISLSSSLSAITDGVSDTGFIEPSYKMPENICVMHQQ